MNQYYVYVLRDPRIDDFVESIFYVGKGTGSRAIAHSANALEALGIRAEEDISGSYYSEKEIRLRELHALGLTEKIDVLLGSSLEAISEEQAFVAEAALIEVLRLKSSGLTNLVKGHGLKLVPDQTFNVGLEAKAVELPEDMLAVRVSVKGLWSPRDYNGTFVGASLEEVWESSRQLWAPFAIDKQEIIISRATTDNPVRLIALAEDPRKRHKNIIVGVFPIASAILSPEGELKGGDHKCKSECALGDSCDNRTRSYVGWVLTENTASNVNDDWMLKGVLTVNGQEVPRSQSQSYLPNISAWS